MIRFNVPPVVGTEIDYIKEAISEGRLSGDGRFTMLCQQWIDRNFGCYKSLLTPSCTHAIEMAAILIGIEPGDEVIMPSYTFVSTANAFVLRGAKVIFVDIRPDTMNIDETLIEQAISNKSKAIVPVHYAGVSCEMDEIMDIAEKYGLYVIEDAAQGVMSNYKGQALGTIGHFGTFSFHDTKNYTSGGEGGALLVNDPQFSSRAEVIREKGTNRSQFFRGQVDKYTWVDMGSSYLPSEIQAAFLWGQLEAAAKINERRLEIFSRYVERLSFLERLGLVDMPSVPDNCKHNGHMFYLKVLDLSVRSSLIEFLKAKGIMAVFHYIPLHSAPAGHTLGEFRGQDYYTSRESERLVRLPIWYGLSDSEVDFICDQVKDFFDRH